MQIPEANLRNMLKSITAGNHVLNEQVGICKHTVAPCPDCGYDPVRKESTDYGCETCGGVGKIKTETVVTIPASVEQEEDFKYDFSKTGKFVNGQIYLTIDILEINTVLNANREYDLNDYKQMKAMIESFTYIKWKGARYDIDSFEPGWLQTNLYEIGFVLSIME